jgi:hypothetical protein
MGSFTKAEKRRSRLRLAAFGPSGSGKTYTSLQLAKGMCETPDQKIAVIDTEFGSAEKYADRFDFDTAHIEQPTVSQIIDMINEARGYHVLIIDSLTHPWQELLQEIDQLAKAKYKGNTWSAWSDGTPKQKALIRAILSFPGHIIATMRSKTEWTTVERNGRKSPERVGLAPEQGKGIEYEFDMLMEINPDHLVRILKDRTGKFQDKMIETPGPDFGREIASWLDEGAERLPTKYEEAQETARATIAELSRLASQQSGSMNEQQKDFINDLITATGSTSDEWDAIAAKAQRVIEKMKTEPVEEGEEASA